MKTPPFKPLSDYILVSAMEPEEDSPIRTPDNLREKPLMGRVVCVGDGRMTEAGVLVPMRIQPNDVVYFGKYAGKEIKISEVDYLIMREDEVVGTLLTA